MNYQTRKKEAQIRMETKKIKIGCMYAYSTNGDIIIGKGIISVRSTNSLNGTASGTDLHRRPITINVKHITSGIITQQEHPEYWL